MNNVTEVRVIVDTNIWISYLIGRKLSRLMSILSSPNIQLIFSDELLDEIYAVSRRKKFAKYFSSDKLMEDFILFLRSIGEVVTLSDTPCSLCRDAKDDYLLEMAIKSNADYLITGDKDLLVIAKIEQCSIVSIIEFELIWNNSDTMILSEPTSTDFAKIRM